MIFAGILNAVVVCFAVWAALFVVRQRRKRRARQDAKDLVISPMAGLTIGAMLLGFQAIVQPQIRHAVVEMQKEKSVDDANGEEPPGGREFHEQLRRIRNGEEVDSLTLRGEFDAGLQ